MAGDWHAIAQLAMSRPFIYNGPPWGCESFTGTFDTQKVLTRTSETQRMLLNESECTACKGHGNLVEHVGETGRVSRKCPHCENGYIPNDFRDAAKNDPNRIRVTEECVA